MSAIDWGVLIAFLAFMMFDGLRRAKGNKDATDAFLAGRRATWWVMGLSVMATQASAITMIGTTGKGWQDGTRFVQFYFALPIAMAVLAFTLVPLFHRHQVFTAYEYLGLRFDRKTRLLAALVFLVLRCLSVGIVIYAPAVVLAALLDVSSTMTIIVMGGIAILYSTYGGMAAVLATDVKQMTLVFIGLLTALTFAAQALPADVGVPGALELADRAGKLVVADFSWNPSEKYTVWSSLIGGLFLFLGYFGCDQSQVQRFLSGASLSHCRRALLFNAIVKVPFQLMVLCLGVLLWAVFLFDGAPVSFIPEERGSAERAGREYRAREQARERTVAAARRYLADPDDATVGSAFDSALVTWREAQHALRERWVESPDDTPKPETNYVFPHFILSYLPIGVIGLLIASILAAALSSIDSELNSLATVAVIDGYEYGLGRHGARDGTRGARFATLAFGILATSFALYGDRMESVVEAVNRIGSYFYGSLLGAFVLVAFPRVGGHGAFFGMLAGVGGVAWIGHNTESFLYLNTAGTVIVVVVGLLVSIWYPRETQSISANSTHTGA